MNPKSLAAILIIACSFSTNTLAACNIVNGKAYGDCAGVSVNKGTKGKLTVSSHVYESGIIEGGESLLAADCICRE